MPSVTTATGATVSLSTQGSHTYVVLDHPDAPQDMRNVEAGRVVQGAFQPAPFSAYGLTSATLRALADLLDQHNTPPAAPKPERASRKVLALATIVFGQERHSVVHLLRATATGTPSDPTLCGIDRFAKDSPGWSIGGGLSGGDYTSVACSGCVQQADALYPGLPVYGSTHGHLFGREVVQVMPRG